MWNALASCAGAGSKRNRRKFRAAGNRIVSPGTRNRRAPAGLSEKLSREGALHHGRASRAALVLLAPSGCAVLTAAPPQVEVARVALRDAGLLDQSLAVALCVANPNNMALDFRRVRVAVDVSGALLADGESEVPVRLPPRFSTLVPFAVATTLRNLGPQLLGVVRNGAVGYRMRGTVQLDGAVPIVLPCSRSGRLDAAAARGLLADAGPPSGSRCGGVS